MDRRHGAGSVRRIGNRSASAVLGGVLVLGLAGCGGQDSEADKAAGSGSTSAAAEPSEEASTPEPLTPEEREEKAVTKAYLSFRAEQSKAFGKATTKGTQIETFAAGVALLQVEKDMEFSRKEGVITKGATQHEPSVDVLELKPTKGGTLPRATITDCVDVTKVEFVYEESGKPYPMPDERLPRYEAKVKAEKWGKQWKVLEAEAQSSAC